jgi:archaellum component FlaC
MSHLTGKDEDMNTQVNWNKIRSEFQRLTDVEQLKSEVQRIRKEIRSFDYHAVLSPSAKTKVKNFEKRYAELMRTIHQAQRQMDREFNRILRQIHVHRSDVSKVVNEQKAKLEKVSKDLRQRFAKKSAASATKTARRPARTVTRKKSKTSAGSKRRKA